MNRLCKRHLENSLFFLTLIFSGYTLKAQNVGIGTTNPTVKLQINDFDVADTTYIKIASRGENVGAQAGKLSGIQLLHFNDNFGFRIESFESSAPQAPLRGLYFNSWNSAADVKTRLFINRANGNIGVGTTTPAHPLEIATGAQPYTSALSILPSTSANSKRASIQLDDWELLQDLAGVSNTKDFAIYQRSTGLQRIVISTAGNVGIGSIFPDASALIDMTSTKKGMLIPRMTWEQMNAIVAPATGLMVFVNTDSSFYYREGLAWKKISGNGENWKVTGNALATGKFIGTTDTAAFRIRTRNVERITIDSTGYIGVNNQKPTAGIHMVDDGRGNSDFVAEYNRNNHSARPALTLQQSRGTFLLKLAVDSGTTLGAVEYNGYNGTDFSRAAEIAAITEGSFSLAAQRKVSLRFYSSNGTGFAPRMIIGSNGNLGIATSKTDRPLTIKGNATNDLISLQRNSDSLTRWHLKLSGVNQGDLNFAETNIAENRLYLAAGGNVGIGTSAPTQNLDIRGNGTDTGAVLNLGNSDNSHQLVLFGGRQSDPNPYIGWQAGDPLRFASYTNGFTEWMRIAADGNVGIGTTTPATPLHVMGNDNILTLEEIAANDVGSGSLLVFKGQTGGSVSKAIYIGLVPSDNTYPHRNGSYEIRIADRLNIFRSNDISASNMGITLVGNTGNVGIGTDAPANKLELGNYGNGNDTYLAIKTSGGNKYIAGIRLRHFDDKNGFDLVSDEKTPAFYINHYAGSATATTPFTINFFDNVGIGTAAPTAKLSVNGTANNSTGAWGVFSDERIKTVTNEFTDGLNVIEKINPVVFKYNSDAPFATDKEQVGVVAQELEKIAPYMVSQQPIANYKDLREVSNQAYTFLLINAVKEQQAQIEKLKKEMEAMKQELKDKK